jgi:hypothetical protein
LGGDGFLVEGHDVEQGVVVRHYERLDHGMVPKHLDRFRDRWHIVEGFMNARLQHPELRGVGSLVENAVLLWHVAILWLSYTGFAAVERPDQESTASVVTILKILASLLNGEAQSAHSKGSPSLLPESAPMDRVTDLADPNRCKGAAPDGQCRNVAEPGCEYCRAHGGSDKLTAQRKSKYHLTRHRARVAELANHEDATTLQDEIAMVGQLIEEVWNRINDTDASLISGCGELNRLFMTLEKLIKTSEAVKRNNNLTLSKTTIIVFGQEMIGILKEELRGTPGFEERVDRITTRMLDAIEHTTNNPEEQ